jgi:hypothetical protein
LVALAGAVSKVGKKAEVLDYGANYISDKCFADIE